VRTTSLVNSKSVVSSVPLDSNGILAVTAMDKVTGAQANAEIKADRGRLTDSDIERMIADAERYREEDLALARKIHLRNAFEEAVYSLKSNMTEKNDISGISDLDEVLTWLEYDSESASYEELQRKADQLYTKFGYRVDATRRMEA
jgi:molecular chaperone DnaK (HSP70)